jgi:hypothetical protein
MHLILTGLLVLALLGGVYLFESKRADVADARSAQQAEITKIAEKAAADSEAKNAILQQENRQTLDTLSAANAQLAAVAAQLQAANKQLALALAAQQKVDATLPPTGQAARWEKIVPNATVAVTPTGFALDAASGLATLQALEEIPTDQQTIANDNATLAKDLEIHQNDVAALASEQRAHTSDLANDALVLAASRAETKKAKDDLLAYKAHSRKNYIRAFFFGVAVGIIGGHYL